MGAKTFKTLDEQIDILKGKGLVIDDIEYTKKYYIKRKLFLLDGISSFIYEQ